MDPRTRLRVAALVVAAGACGRGATPSANRHDAATSRAPAPSADAAVENAPRAGTPSDAAAVAGGPAAGPPLNVVLITIDSLRADMPWAGYARPIAPQLTALEARAVSYTHAYALSSYTSMSLGGLLAGRLPGELSRSGYFF